MRKSGEMRAIQRRLETVVGKETGAVVVESDFILWPSLVMCKRLWASLTLDALSFAGRHWKEFCRHTYCLCGESSVLTFLWGEGECEPMGSCTPKEFTP